jgi:HPt (histidine-containing phosphotransfer) domain-containing protein
MPFDDQIYLSIFTCGDADGAAWLNDWLATVRHDVDELTATLNSAAVNDVERDVVRLMAHRVAGAAFSVGAMLVGDSARALENAARDASLQSLRALHAEVRQEVAASNIAIKAFLAG